MFPLLLPPKITASEEFDCMNLQLAKQTAITFTNYFAESH